MRWFIPLIVLCGCETNPFPGEQNEYVIAFVIDRSTSYEDDLADTAFRHFALAREALSQGAMGTNCLILLSCIHDGQESVLFEGSPQSFMQRFPTKEKFEEFLGDISGSSPVYLSCADTINRLCRRHEESPGMKSILLIYSDMEDNHGGEEKLDEAVRRYAQYKCAVGVYRVSNEEWAGYFRDRGVKHVCAYDSKRQDPPLPILP